MRKYVVVVSLFLSVVLFSAAVADVSVVIGSDVPSGWYFLPAGCVVSFPDGVDSASMVPGSGSFTAPIGQYIVGVDIPVGTYSVRCADGVNVTTVKFCRDSSNSWFMLEALHADEGESIGRVELLEGYTVEVRNGSAYFSAPSGIVFD